MWPFSDLVVNHCVICILCQFIISSPYAYHAGFNLGLNGAEAANFALNPYWIEYGVRFIHCLCIALQPVIIDTEPYLKKYQKDPSLLKGTNIF